MHRHDHRFASHESEPQADLVFDFSGAAQPDLGDIVLVLTARMVAGRDHRKVWVTAMSERTWQLFGALGLDDLFEQFPESETTEYDS